MSPSSCKLWLQIFSAQFWAIKNILMNERPSHRLVTGTVVIVSTGYVSTKTVTPACAARRTVAPSASGLNEELWYEAQHRPHRGPRAFVDALCDCLYIPEPTTPPCTTSTGATEVTVTLTTTETSTATLSTTGVQTETATTVVTAFETLTTTETTTTTEIDTETAVETDLQTEVDTVTQTTQATSLSTTTLYKTSYYIPTTYSATGYVLADTTVTAQCT